MSALRPLTLLESVLVRRADKLASRTETPERGRTLGTFAMVDLSGHRVGLPVLALREIVRTPPITPLPNLPPWLAGIALVRGGLVSVLDLGRLYGISPVAGGGYLAVLTAAPGEIGVLADGVLGFREIFADEVVEGAADPAAHTGVPSHGTTRDLVTLLDVERLFADERVVADDASVGHPPPEVEAPSGRARRKR